MISSRKAARDVRVWRAGSPAGGARREVHDWSWRRTRRRIGLLVRLARPYGLRTAAAVATLLAFTVVGLAPPYLAKLAVDEGISQGTSSG